MKLPAHNNGGNSSAQNAIPREDAEDGVGDMKVSVLDRDLAIVFKLNRRNNTTIGQCPLRYAQKSG